MLFTCYILNYKTRLKFLPRQYGEDNPDDSNFQRGVGVYCA